VGTVPCGCDGADDGDAAFPFQGAAAGERLCGVRATHPRLSTWLADRRCLPFIGQSNPNVALFPGFSPSGIARSSIAVTHVTYDRSGM
jgi:hypothetical protein